MTPLPEEKTVRGVKRLKREPRPLHHTFHNFVVTNRSMRRNKKTIARLLKDAIKSGDMLRHAQVMDEINR